MQSVGLRYHQHNILCKSLCGLLSSLHVLPTPLVFPEALQCQWVQGVLESCRDGSGRVGMLGRMQVPGVCPSWQGQQAP